MSGRQALTRSIAEESRAVAYDPGARSYEAFGFGAFGLGGRGTNLLDPLEASTLDDALAETTSRWHWDRGDRLGVREIGENVDLLHVYAARRTSSVTSYRAASDNPLGRTPLEYKRRLEHICTIDLRVISGDHIELIGNPSLDDHRHKQHNRRQAQRPEGARL